ncbi:hypothetical protein, partial [uncultured Ruminococcus sp.]
AKFAEKTRVYACEDRFLQFYYTTRPHKKQDAVSEFFSDQNSSAPKKRQIPHCKSGGDLSLCIF